MVRNISFIFFFLFLSLTSLAQDKSEALASFIDSTELKNTVYELASPRFEGRETGHAGQKLAAQYIANYFQSLGLAPVYHNDYYQSHALSLKANKKFNLETHDKQFLFLEDFYYLPGYADSTYSIDEVVFAGYGISDSAYEYNDFAGISIKDKALLIYEAEPHNEYGKSKFTKSKTNWSEWSTDFTRKMNLLQSLQPKIIFIATNPLYMIDSLQYTTAQACSLMNCNGYIPPVVFINEEIAHTMFSESEEYLLLDGLSSINRKKPRSFSFKTNTSVTIANNIETLTGDNVIGVIEGSDKAQEVLIITAHYDHLGIRDSAMHPGADDNATGTAAVMQLAKIFSIAAERGIKPKRSVAFMCVSGEEKGLLGSKYFVNHPVIPLENIITNLNIDMIGRTDPRHDSIEIENYIYVIGSNKLSTKLHEINEEANKLYGKTYLDYKYNDTADVNRYYYRSDHYNFVKHNIPAIFYFSGVHPDYHKPTDTADKIKFDLMYNRTKLIFHTAWMLANTEDEIIPDLLPSEEE